MSTECTSVTGAPIDAPTDAADYVNSIMSSQRFIRVDTPPTSGRKRHLSLPGSAESTVKKSRHHETPARVTTRAKRSLYSSNTSDAPVPAPRTQADVNAKANDHLEQLITKLSTDVHTMFSNLTQRMEKLETGLEQRISNKVSQLLDKRVTTELNRVRKDVDKRIGEVKDSIIAEVSVDLEQINDKLASLTSGSASTSEPDIGLNVIVRNLGETTNENVPSKVNTLIRDGLKIPDVKVSKAERKQSRDGKAGVIVATFSSQQDKKKVMLAKAKLRNSNQFPDVFINHDQSRSDRVMADNFRTILTALKHRDTDLSIRGNRVVRQSNHSQGRGRRDSPGSSHSSQSSRDQSSRDTYSRDQSSRTQRSNDTGGSWSTVGRRHNRNQQRNRWSNNRH